MCRSTTDIWLAAGGTSVAGLIAALRIHWDMLRDRQAWRDAMKRRGGERDSDDEPADAA